MLATSSLAFNTKSARYAVLLLPLCIEAWWTENEAVTEARFH